MQHCQVPSMTRGSVMNAGVLATRLGLVGWPVEAEEAHRLGIVNRVVSSEDLEAEAQAFAERIAQGPSITLGYMKRNLNAAESKHLGECLDLEASGHSRTGMPAAHKEAAQAFVDKRPPEVRGR